MVKFKRSSTARTASPLAARSDHDAPAYLTETFDSSEALFDSYTKWRDAAMERDDAKFVVFHVPGQGWGNRIRTFAAAYLLAVYSGRVFVVDWQHPVPLSDIFEPRMRALPAALRSTVLGRANDDVSIVYKGPNDPVSSHHFKHLSAENVAGAYGHARTVHVTGYVSFAQALVDNPVYKRWHPLFDGDMCPLQSVFAYLFAQPSPALQELMQPVLERMQAASVVIGLQMRLGTETNWFHKGPYASSLESRPALLAQYEDPARKIDLWTDCAHRAVAEELSMGGAPVVFVATDNGAAVARAEQVLAPLAAEHGLEVRDVLLTLEGPSEHSGGIEPQKTQRGQLKAMADWYLLGESNVLYRTWWSTYGYTAALRTGCLNVAIPHQYSEACDMGDAVDARHTKPEYTNHC